MLNKLTKDALLGTEYLDQQAVPEAFSQSSEPVNQVLAQINKTDPAHALLASAGVLAIHKEIGCTQILPSLERPIGPPPISEKEVCPADVAILFDRFLRRGDIKLIRLMLEEIDQRNWRIPAAAVPDLLKLGSKNNLMRPHVIDAIGPFGRWLAAQNSAWHYALIPVLNWDQLNQMWQDSPTQIRISMLSWLRRTDPIQGLNLLESQWPSEPDANRHALISGLRNGLDMSDEPFLESALDARQVIVRKRAYELLSTLPESRYAQRLQKYNDIIFAWDLDKRPFLTVRVPVTMSPSMKRDGLMAQTEKRKVDFITRRLTHLIQHTPLDYWTGKTGLTPDEFVLLVQKTNWPRTFTNGLTTATHRQNRSDWAEAIFQYVGLSSKTGAAVKAITPENIGRLAKIALTQPLTNSKMVYGHPIYILLKEWKHPWPEDIAYQIGQKLANFIQSETAKNVPNTSVRSWLSNLLADASPALVEQFETMFTFDGEVHAMWKSAVEKGLRQSHSKAEMARIMAKYV